MALIEFTILGHTHRLTCQPGEEARLKALAEKFNESAESVSKSLRTSDHKLIYIVAALTLLDEAEEDKQQDEAEPDAVRVLELICDKVLEIKKRFELEQ